MRKSVEHVNLIGLDNNIDLGKLVRGMAGKGWQDSIKEQTKNLPPTTMSLPNLARTIMQKMLITSV